MSRNNDKFRKTPKSILAINVFKPMYQLLEDLNSGEVAEDEGDVLIDGTAWNRNDNLSASETVESWCNHFKAICTLANLPMTKDTSLRKIAELLTHDEIELHEYDLTEAKNELAGMRSVWVKVPFPIIQKAVLPHLPTTY